MPSGSQYAGAMGPGAGNSTGQSTGDTIHRIHLALQDYGFESRGCLGKGKGWKSRFTGQPLPEKLEGSAGFNLGSAVAIWGKIPDGRASNRFPRYVVGNTITRPNTEKLKQFKGYVTSDDRGTGRFIDPLPLETGHTILLAPDAPERTVTITSQDAELMLFDGRVLAQNGWFVVRSLLPAENRQGADLDRNRMPLKDGYGNRISGFQVGYLPRQQKTAVIN